jgi:ABC-type nitrate/sulfonate/bicarbonate transport system substrate-binding protein
VSRKFRRLLEAGAQRIDAGRSLTNSTAPERLTRAGTPPTIAAIEHRPREEEMTTRARPMTHRSGTKFSESKASAKEPMLSRRSLFSGGGAAVGFAAAVGLAAAPFIVPAKAQGLTELKMTSFGSATNLPIWIATDRGVFKKEGLKVTLEPTRGSKKQIADIMAGKYQFATTAIGNIIAYTEGQGAAKYDNFDLIAILGVHSGLNTVVSVPAVKTWNDIKGKAVSVDALTSGYATVLYQILRNKGLERDRDYKVIAVGGTGARVKSLKDGRAQMAIISSPANIRLKNEGYNMLADPSVEIGAYQASVYSVRRSYAKTHEKIVLAFIRAVTAAQDAIFNNKSEAMAVLKAHARGISEKDLAALYDRMIGPGGFNRGAALNIKGIETVLKLRSIYSGAKGPMPSPSKYIDTSYAEKAKRK